MTTPSVPQVLAWRPEALTELATEWDNAAGRLQVQADTVDDVVNGGTSVFTGSAADVARKNLGSTARGLRRVCRGLILAAAEARDAAVVIGRGRDRVLAALAEARGEGCPIADDGTVGPSPEPSALLVICSGGAEPAARQMLDVRAAELTRELQAALNGVGTADADAARAIDAAFGVRPTTSTAVRPAALTGDPVTDWPHMGQDSIAAQVAAMPQTERQRLVEEHPREAGNTDGVPWDTRIAANRVNIAAAILDERRRLDVPDEVKLRAAVATLTDPGDAERLWATLHADPALRSATLAATDRDARHRIEYYESLLADVPDPLDRNRRVPRQILAFDPERHSFIELSGDLDQAHALAVLVPGLNTTFDDATDDVATARRFVAGSGGDVAMITYLGGPFPTGRLAAGIAAAADPRYALQMAPRLVAFSEDVERRAGAMPVTYLGHSYGGSVLGTAERFGLTADRVVYVEAAGAGVGVQNSSDWHNRNPAVLRFSITAPGDPIGLVQGVPFGPHGADPDRIPGVIRLASGRRLTGAPMAGPSTHSDVLNEPSDAWHNILAVITGDREHIRTK
ncbi:alpha/beta hydrolase [Mycolicibacterium sphagni]|uniref:alpha/beta hydrolase n=1 Tax=Mycolicibacterium sphagni TaxID=1786 RepID=UPI0021F2E2F9|nr:alpha/beta hydrolase [Mycolicibacterium sphagni]MCV7174506.1 alpha/beta hydrolase [Mycolicibacterium sphagni]